MCGREEWYESTKVTSDSEVTNTLFSDLLYELYSRVRDPPPMPGVVFVVVRRSDTNGTSRLLENCPCPGGDVFK